MSFDLAGSLVAQIGVGGVVGFIIGFAAKKMLKLLAILVALVFVFFQFLAWKGFIDIHYDKIYIAAQEMFQQAGVGITEFNVPAFITANIPLAGSFIAGLLLGFKIG